MNCVCAEKVWKCAVCGGLNWGVSGSLEGFTATVESSQLTLSSPSCPGHISTTAGVTPTTSTTQKRSHGFIWWTASKKSLKRTAYCPTEKINYHKIKILRCFPVTFFSGIHFNGLIKGLVQLKNKKNKQSKSKKKKKKS